MATRTSFILKAMNVIFWVIFIGLCIKTGSLLYSYFISIAINPAAAQNLYMGLNLSELYNYGIVHYSVIVCMLIVLTGLKAYIGYWVVKISIEMRMEKPFSEGINRIITKISRIALWAGLLAIVAHEYSRLLIKKLLIIPIDWAYGEILFFAGVIYIIAQVFEKGIELQSENELTV
jgi:magnesium-transporting ATPase (P-type)